MAPGAVGQQGVAAANNVVLPEQWTASTATVAATLAALKKSMAAPPTSPPAELSEPAPQDPPAPVPLPATAADRPPLPTRRSLREAAERNGRAPTHRGRGGLFTRLLTVRAFRTGHARARAASAPSQAVGAILEAAGVHGVLTLHQRRVPGHRGRIEHLAISACGVHVVDVRHFKNAAIELRPAGVAGSPVELVVGGRVMTTAAAATARRVAGIRSILAGAGLDNVRVTGALCFVDGLLPLGVTDLRLHGVHILRPSNLTALVTRSGSLDAEHVLTLQEYLARHLPEGV
jgi:hypothetical protein